MIGTLAAIGLIVFIGFMVHELFWPSEDDE